VRAVLEQVVQSYTGQGLNGYAYLTHDAEKGVYTVISVGYVKNQRSVDANLIVRLLADRIVIERDMNDKTLVEALLQAGIPRSHIILAYAGEPAPEVV
jgi:hypothetical protein